MTRVLRSAVKKSHIKDDFINELSINKKSKTIKKSADKVKLAMEEENNQNDIWNIGSIRSNIFAYTEFKDLVNFNTVCKRWNNVSNHIIHKTIKLKRRWDIMKQIYGKRFNSAANIEEVDECISNNAKNAPFVKEFKYNYKLNPLRAIKVFETFRFICDLTIGSCDMSQGQFLGMISPLNQLRELTLSYLRIKNSFGKRFYKEAVQLPPTLKKLTLYDIKLAGCSKLFVKTINSHNNLVEFTIYSCINYEFLEPFYKHYPSLLKFVFYNNKLQTFPSLFYIFEHNPQLIKLNLSLKLWSSELISHINNYLINLEELKLSEIGENGINYTDSLAKFSQPTKIKKLDLKWARLSNCSTNSILLSCPHLEELDLNPYTHYKRPNSIEYLNFSNPAKLKKLAVNCDTLSEGVFDSILLNSTHINELDIILPREWKGVIKSIHEKCANLERLSISPPIQLYFQNLYDKFKKEFYETELFTSDSKCKSTLTHLTLNQFKVQDSKVEYFKKFKILKSIKYIGQPITDFNNLNQETENIKNLWPSYRLHITEKYRTYDAELKRY